MKWHWRTILAMTLLALPAAADAPGDLLKRLAGDDWADRQAAEDALVAKGPPILDDLNAAVANTTDIELRERLNSAIARINKESLTSATLVNISKDFEHPIDALRALANHVGLLVVAENDKAAALVEQPKLTSLRCSHTPLLEALLNCAADAGVSIRITSDRITVLEQPATEGRPRMVSLGAIALVADSVRRIETIDFASDRHNGGLSATFTLYTEPKLQLASGTAALSIRSLVDEQNRSLLRRSGKFPFLHLPDGRWQCNVPLVTLDPAATHIAKVDTELVTNIIAGADELKVEDLTALPQDMQTSGGVVGIRSVSQANGNWAITIHVPQNQAGVNAFGAFGPNSWQYNDPDLLKITDAHGRRLTTGVPSMATGDDIEMTMPITLAAPDDPPHKVVMRMPSKMREFKAPAAFSDLALP